MMAWSVYNNSMGSNPLFGQADQASEDRNYNSEFYGYQPSVLLLENAPPFSAGDSLYNSVVQSPQPNWHTLVESTRSAFHGIGSHITDLAAINFDNLEASIVDGVAELDKLQDIEHDAYQSPNQKRKAE
jgi:hypothetical protein